MDTSANIDTPEIKDDLAHYFGATEFNHRAMYFEDSNPRWGTRQQRAQQTDIAVRLQVLNKIIKELERLGAIRSLLSQEPSECHLILRLDESRQAWTASEEYSVGIANRFQEGGLVNDWSERNKFHTSPSLEFLKELRRDLERISQSQPTSTFDHSNTSPGSSGEPSTRVKQLPSESPKSVPTKEPAKKTGTRGSTHIDYDPDEDLDTYLIQYKIFDNGLKPSMTPEYAGIIGNFPDQRVPVRHILGEIDPGSPSNSRHQDTVDRRKLTALPFGNILKDLDKTSNKIRYFHFPANNMAWAERAMALHYEDETASRLGNLDVSEIAQRSRIDTLLRSEYWRGQQHGHQGAPLHAHHMTPLCSTIPLGADGETASQPKDLVLFMPYLHWETDRKRFSFASFLDNVTAAHKAEHDSLLRVTRQRAIRDREDLEKPARFQQAHRPFESISYLPFGSDLYESSRPLDEHRRVMSRVPFDGNNQNRLGQYLMDASRLYEGISNYRDKKLLHKYLYVDAPIHPRRTLDQAYYWSLQSTDNRDRDQVVYRATTAAAKSRHQFDIGRQIWPDHENLHDDGPCQTCRDRVRQTSKLIMVDQLWLWVLDERTILTFFPRRYGTNEDDAAGVHKSIRTRLDHISKTRHPEQRMGSVWDLALIIFDECINTLFDRTKTPDLQPRVMDHFSQAIDDVTNKQAIASGRLWAWTEQWKKALSNKQKSRTADVHIALILDVRPEYKLLYEIKDIIEELNIIIHISRTHNTLLKSFVDQAKHIMDPGRRLQNMFDHGLNMDSTREPKSKMDNRNAGVTAKKVDYDRFGSMAEELVIKVDSRIQTLEDLKKRAESASNSVNELLNRKQQQSSVVQAWQSAQQTEDAVAQGQSVMLFTAVTIVFAPLSFMTSVFGMNSWEFSPEQNTWKILDQLAYILPISVATIMLVLFLAFNPSVTPMINAWYSRIRIKFLTQKIWGGYSLYKIWFGMNLRFGRTWTEQIQKYVENKKEEAQAEVLEQRGKRLQAGIQNDQISQVEVGVLESMQSSLWQNLRRGRGEEPPSV